MNHPQTCPDGRNTVAFHTAPISLGRIVPRVTITEGNSILAAVAEIGFSDRLTPYKIVGRSYLRKYFCIESVTFFATRPHAQLIFFSTVIKKVMNIFQTLGSRSLLVTAMLKTLIFSGKTNQSKANSSRAYSVNY